MSCNTFSSKNSNTQQSKFETLLIIVNSEFEFDSSTDVVDGEESPTDYPKFVCGVVIESQDFSYEGFVSVDAKHTEEEGWILDEDELQSKVHQKVRQFLSKYNLDSNLTNYNLDYTINGNFENALVAFEYKAPSKEMSVLANFMAQLANPNHL